MAQPKGGYRNQAGVRLPSVTTVIDRFKDSRGLMFWAFQQGKDGKDQLYEESSKAADVGTLAHAMVEARIKGLASIQSKELPPELVAKARQAFDNYEKWERQTRLKLIETEMHLVSEDHQYAGTPDAIGEIDLELCLLDWKTSNAIYVDHLIQLAAYRHLWEEAHPDKPLTGGFYLIRFSKEAGDFAHHHFSELDDAWRQFVLLREAYDIDKKLKKRVG